MTLQMVHISCANGERIVRNTIIYFAESSTLQLDELEANSAKGEQGKGPIMIMDSITIWIRNTLYTCADNSGPSCQRRCYRHQVHQNEMHFRYPKQSPRCRIRRV